MNNSRILLEVQQQIATVTLNRADKRNALDMKMFEAIAEMIKRLKKDRNIRVVIVKAEGEDFCSGLDIKSAFKSKLNALKLLWKWLPGNANLAQKVAVGWKRIPVPVIMAIQGRCWGGGLQIALGGDYRIATADANFSIMEGKWGIIPDMGGSVSLRELMSVDDALKYAMTAEIISAEQAKSVGLISDIAEDPYQAALEYAKQLCDKSPDALAAVKKLYHRAWHSNDRKLLSAESRFQWRILLGKNQRIATKKELGDSEIKYHHRKSW
jgi:enoyl-CoA hydratase/carnithine racemase